MEEHYIQQAFQELHKNDGLTIMGRGLGINLLYSKFVQLYSTNVKQNKPLVFCINASGSEESLIDLCLAEGTRPDELPKVTIGMNHSLHPHIHNVSCFQNINNEVNSQERSDMYAEGGCYFITSRILIVDLLDNKVNPLRISGLLIYNAHR